MAATVQIEQVTGAAGSRTYTVKDTGTRLRYYTADESGAALTTNPIPIPTVNDGLSGSYWATTCVNVTAGPTSYIKNLRWYVTMASANMGLDWDLGTNGDMVIGISSPTVASGRTYTQGFSSNQYDQSDGTVGSWGYFISGPTGHTFYSVSCSNALSGGATSTGEFNSLANAYMVQSGQVMGSGATGRSYFIVTQIVVGSGAVQGDKPDKTATYVYSEV